MSDFMHWWEEISIALKIYWSIAILFTLFFALHLLSPFLSSNNAPDATSSEVPVLADPRIVFQFFTRETVIAFFTIVGWAGIACSNSGLKDVPSLAIALVSGLATMTTIAALSYFIERASADGRKR